MSRVLLAEEAGLDTSTPGGLTQPADHSTIRACMEREAMRAKRFGQVVHFQSEEGNRPVGPGSAPWTAPANLPGSKPVRLNAGPCESCPIHRHRPRHPTE